MIEPDGTPGATLTGAARVALGPDMPAAFTNDEAVAAMLERHAPGVSGRIVAREVLTPADLIWPLFVTDGSGVEEPIGSLPGVSRWSVDGIVARAREAVGRIGNVI